MQKKETVELPMTTIHAVSTIGPYHADINFKNANGTIRGPFDIRDVKPSAVPTYPVLWSHDADRERTMCFEGESEAQHKRGKNQEEHELIDLKAAAVWATASHCHFNQNFRFDTSIADGAAGLTSGLRTPASASTKLTEVYNLNGDLLNLTPDSSVLEVTGSRGSTVITPYQLNVTAASTMGDLLAGLQQAFGLSDTPPTLDSQGQIQLAGDVGAASALGDVSIAELGATYNALATAMHFTQTQQARDAGSTSVATTVYDSLGATHTLRFTFSKIAGENAWNWTAATEGDEQITSGGSGQVSFTDAGLISSFTFDGGSSALTLEPQASGTQGAQPVSLSIDFGQIGGVNGLTQFASSGNLASQANGFTVGNLVDYEIDQNGIISGRFSNDTVRNLGQIAIATFSNPDGLLRDASNTFRTSGNSGEPITGFAGGANGVTLESSNVDLAEQFTRLVIAQRAFQANARVITTGDQILQELVSIIR